jgi:hypothetical protein
MCIRDSVGSEMCIRDRPEPLQLAARQRLAFFVYNFWLDDRIVGFKRADEGGVSWVI